MTEKRTATDPDAYDANISEQEDELINDDDEQTLDRETLIQQLQESQAKVADTWGQVLRSRAELDNLRRRSERDIENAHKYALEKIAGDLLPVKDSLELGLSAAQGEGQNFAKLIEGTDLTLKMLRGVMEKSGIREINPLHEKFNPEQHQAMSMQQNLEFEPNTVVAVYQKGYLLNERLLRPALVVVSTGGSGGAKSNADQPSRSQNNDDGESDSSSIDELA